MILQLDIGNTRVKWRLSADSALPKQGVLPRNSDSLLPALDSTPDQVWVSSVAGAEFEAELTQAIRAEFDVEPWFARTGAAACGVTNSYAEPARMGVDRWLAMLAAWHRSPSALCIVDAGSALTIDFVSADGLHRGGYILPGADSMERALLADTDRVRFGDAPRDCLDPGCSTEAAVFNGIQLSQAGAVSTALARYGEDSALYFCGGNGALLKDLVDCGGEFVPDLVLDGLALLAAEELHAA